ncbi:MAG: hypothetical protein ACP5VR_06885 [Acidimicrobiales bacterium]
MTRHIALMGRTIVAVGVAATLLMGTAVTASASRKVASTSSQASARAKIITDWQAFFSGRTPADRKVQLVQDGPQFAPVIKAQASSPLAKSTAAKVSKVTLARTAKTAVVVYSVTLGGKTALAGQKGEAVLLGGTWKVGAESFCTLLKLEGTAPPICKALAK